MGAAPRRRRSRGPGAAQPRSGSGRACRRGIGAAVLAGANASPGADRGARPPGRKSPTRRSPERAIGGVVLETLTKGFRAARQRLTGVAELGDEVIEDALRDVRLSLLEGDVEFRVVKRFLERVREAARGKEVELRAKSKEYGVKSITPEQAFIAICQDELIKMMGPVDTDLKWAKRGATGIMMCGLQGSGKTTSCGKLARWLEKTHKKKPCLVAADIYRPAAVEQLKTLGRQLDMPVWSMEGK